MISAKPMIVSVIEIDNVGVSSISIAFSLEKGPSSSYTTVVEKYVVPHNKTKSVTTGGFPAYYVRLTCHKGTPISMKGLRVFGCDPDLPAEQTEMASQGINIGVQSFL